MRRLTYLVLLPLIVACAHRAPASVDHPKATATVSAVLEPADEDAVTSDSKDLRDAVLERMARRGIRASTGSEAHHLRSTEARLRHVAMSSEADHVVLIEAEPTFVSQVAGRYRWKVAVTVTIAPRNDLEKLQTWTWKIPVFLRFYHQREAHALDGAVPVLERNLDRALTEYLGS